jgi:hypothetical protein
MYRLRGHGSLLRFLVGAVGAFSVVAFSIAVLLKPPTTPVGAPRVLTGEQAGYEVELVAGGLSRVIVAIGAAGEGCEKLNASRLLGSSCVLATRKDPAQIGATAKGLLNVGDDPAYEAIIWRAVFSGDVLLCASGGLLDDHLESCLTAASKHRYSVSDAGLTVTVATTP